MNPQYPVYIVSKGRWANPLTANALTRMGVPFHIVIEPQEANKYAEAIGADKLLVLPFSNLRQGSIPARNYIWEHAITSDYKRHWILDDNIRRFCWLNRNQKMPFNDGSCFRLVEYFVERYTNIGLAGLQYAMFAPRRKHCPPVILNTRIYSCILILNALPYRWRGRYNEDTDLSLRVLKDGWCTILFNTFLAHKITTMHMRGGNTDELYIGDGRLRMAQALCEQHPDVTRIVYKWGRYQHSVDYRPFRHNTFIKHTDNNQPVPCHLRVLLNGIEVASENIYTTLEATNR